MNIVFTASNIPYDALVSLITGDSYQKLAWILTFSIYGILATVIFFGTYPIINKQLITSNDNVLDFHFNYSNHPQTVKFCSKAGESIVSDLSANEADTFTLDS